MGGQLKLRSTPGEGSHFSFTLPLPTAPAHADDAVEAAGLSQPAPRVLIVDDNPAARDILSTMTRSWSWPTETASSGVEALDLIRARLTSDACPFDVIYLDWQMPDMDGWDTVRQIRALCHGELRPRIVMLTSNGRDTLLVRSAQDQAMVDGFLFKPVLARALRDAATGRILSDSSLQRVRSSSRLLAGMRILVVEDNLINQQVAAELLTAEGALVTLAANGQLGVDAVAVSHLPFDVVLMDIQMPVLDGYGATRKIREQLGFMQLPIVAMTANALPSDRQACLAAGMNDHVGKPFDLRLLVALLLKVTGRDPQGLSSIILDTGKTELKSDSLSGPYLDVTVAMERLSGLTTLYLDIAVEYLKALESVEGEFRQAAEQEQWNVLVSQMHSLKGVSATLGAQALSEHAARLEKLFRVHPVELVALEQLPDLLALVSATHVAMQSAVQFLAAEVVEEPQPDHLQVGPVERADARAFLSELLDLLAANNLAALERFSSRGHALDALSKNHLDELQAAMGSLNLESARLICEAQMKAMDGALTRVNS
jgi:CheY-like chemotaxis protein